MAKDRMLFLISFAFLGLIAAFLFHQPDSQGHSSETKKEFTGSGSSVTEVLVAQQDLKPNERLTPKAYAWKKIDLAEFYPSLVTRNAQTEIWLKDAILVRAVSKGDKILHKDILWPGDAHVIHIPITPGKRAVPFELTTRSGIVQFINAGTLVDITFTSKADIGFGAVSLTLLKNIRVLAVGKSADGDKSFKSNSPIELLLEMTPRQAEIFFYAQSAGTVSLGIMDSDPPEERNELAEVLLKSETQGSFHSVLVTHTIQTLFPNIDVTITSTPKGYIVAGKVPDPQKAGKIIEILEKLAPDGDKAIVNLLEVEPQQVLISVKVFEVDKNVRANLGLNWEVLFHHASGSVAAAAIFPSPALLDANYFLDATGLTYGNFTLSALIDMMQENGCGRVIAEPNLTTVSGRTAHFFAGGEFPILIPQGGSLAGTVTVEFKKFGVLLDFTPIVDLNGLITLHVVPEISTIDKANAVVLQGFVIPSVNTRRVDTMVKLWPGQCYIIAGLLQSERIQRNNHLFCLDQLPIIGPLFCSKSFLDRRSELVIMVTPYLISSDRVEQEKCEQCGCVH